MNARQIIRDTIADLITINRDDIESAIMNIDISCMIKDELDEQLPDAIAEIIKEEISEAVSDAIESQLN